MVHRCISSRDNSAVLSSKAVIAALPSSGPPAYNSVMKLGMHIGTAGNLAGAPARAADMGAETIQIFASNPRGWRPTNYTPDQASAFQAAATAAGINPVWF